MVRFNAAVVALCLSAGSALASGEFQTGCERAATEVWCEGHKDCKVGSIMGSSKKGNDSEKSGYEECKAFAATVKELGVSLEAKRAIKRMQGKIDAVNKDLKELGIKVTADFKRLEVEEWYINATFMDHYKTTERDRSKIAALTFDGESKQFEMSYLDPIKTALFNVAKDDEGKEALKAKVQEVRLGFYSHGRTGWNPEIKVVDKVLIVPGVYSVDQTGYTGGVQKFIEKYL